MQFRYILTGHGFKGKQHGLDSDDDIVEMYDVYRGRRNSVIFWVKIKVAGQARKRPLESSDKPSTESDQAPKRTSYQNHLSKMAEVDIIVDKLQKKHDTGKFSPEQIRAWAHMLHFKKHVSYDEPPDKPFFRLKGSTAKAQGLSPAKRITNILIN